MKFDRFAWLSAAIAAAIISVFVAGAAAQDSAYCRRTRARAEADAALLAWPSILAEGVRFPSNGRIDIGSTVGDNFQARVALTFSPLDLYRSGRLTSAADADCERHEIEQRVRELFADGLNLETLQALRAQAAYLEAHRAEWRNTMIRADARLKAGLIMVYELHELRRFVWVLEHKFQAVTAQIARLEVQAPKPRAAWDPLIEQYLKGSLQLDRELSHLRALDAWGVKVTGGVIPMPGKPVDWYGFLEVGYGLGGIGRNRHEAEYLSARNQELRQAAYELPARAQELRQQIAVEIVNAQRELSALEGELAAISTTQAALDTADVPQAEHARAMLMTETLVIESDRVYYRALLEALTRLQETRGKS